MYSSFSNHNYVDFLSIIFNVYYNVIVEYHTALIDLNCVKVSKLPCDVDYYLAPEDAQPALTIKKGSLVNVIPDNVGGFGFSTIGYGLQCWPDYVSGWRYGSLNWKKPIRLPISHRKL